MNYSDVCQVMFIDPDSDWLASTLRTLKDQGIVARSATDLGKATRILKRTHGRQLVFVDLEFAERAPHQLREFATAENRYVVVLSPVDLTPNRMSRVFKLGAYDCVGKPYVAQFLIKLVTSMVEEVCIATSNAAPSLTSSFVFAI